MWRVRCGLMNEQCHLKNRHVSLIPKAFLACGGQEWFHCREFSATHIGSATPRAGGKRCASGGGSADPVVCAIGSSSSERYLVRVHDWLGLEHVQWHGRCGGGCGRACVQLAELAGQWLCAMIAMPLL